MFSQGPRTACGRSETIGSVQPRGLGSNPHDDCLSRRSSTPEIEWSAALMSYVSSKVWQLDPSPTKARPEVTLTVLTIDALRRCRHH